MQQHTSNRWQAAPHWGLKPASHRCRRLALVCTHRAFAKFPVHTRKISLNELPRAALERPRRPVSGNRTVEKGANREAEEEADESKGVATIVKFVRSRSWKEAARAYLMMSSSGLELSEELQSCLMQGACNTGDFNLCWRVYKALPPDANLPYSVYQKLICLALKAGSSLRCLKIFKALKSAGYSPNRVTYCTLISGLLRNRRKGSRNVQVAYDLWKELEGSGDVLDGAALRVGCNACVSRGKIEEAKEFVSRMRMQGLRADSRVYNILLKGHCRKGEMEAALEVLESMKFAGVDPDQISYNTLIHGFISIQQMENAMIMLENAQSEGVAPDVWTYTTMLRGFVKSKNMTGAENMLLELKKAGCKPNVVTFGTLIDGYVSCGKRSKARSIFQEMLDMNVKPTTVIFNTLLKGYSRNIVSIWPEQFRELQKEMDKHGIVPGVDTYNTILSHCLDQGHPDICVEVFNHMIGIGLKADGVTCTILMKCFHRQGDKNACQEVQTLLELSPGAENDLIARNALVACYAQRDKMELAETALVEAVRHAQSHGQPVPVEAFGAVIEGYSAAGNLPKAIATFRHFFQIGGNPDQRMFKMLLKLCLDKGDTTYARKVLRAMRLSGIEVNEDSSKNPSSTQSLVDACKPPPNVNVERFKFWLGLPNSYYDSSWP